MIYSRGFLGLQLTFAERVRELSDIPLTRALLDYTNLYVRLGFGRAFDEQHAEWQAYSAGLRSTADVREYTYAAYLRTAGATTAPVSLGRSGCFSWAREEHDRIRLHFLNEKVGDVSPLAALESGARLSELRGLFGHVKSVVGGAGSVVGISWLYNLEAYRRLFPPGYGESRRVVPSRFRGMSLWGQFLDYRGELKQSAASRFLKALERQSSVGELASCFPFPVLTTEAPLQEFYSYYRL